MEPWEVWEVMRKAMVNAVKTGAYTDDYIWTDGSEILCNTENRAEVVADFLEALGFEEVRTGYYDPEEDKRNHEVDHHTGWWYVDFD